MLLFSKHFILIAEKGWWNFWYYIWEAFIDILCFILLDTYSGRILWDIDNKFNH